MGKYIEGISFRNVDELIRYANEDINYYGNFEFYYNRTKFVTRLIGNIVPINSQIFEFNRGIFSIRDIRLMG